MQNTLQLPSRIHQIHFLAFANAGVQVFIKREDEIHPVISGNKWRKLCYNLLAISASGMKGFVTFGGAFSNHLAAAAYAGFLAKLQMIALVRGEEADLQNPTLRFVQQCGMKILPLSRSEYARKNDPDFLQKLHQEYPDLAIIPEGGSNLLGVKGCMEILPETDAFFDVVACPLGTATTFAGLVLSAPAATKVLGFPALKGGDYLRGDVQNFIAQAKSNALVPATFKAPVWQLQNDFHVGGFGKVSSELIRFMNDFYAESNVPLDPIYTGKMMFGLAELAKQGKFEIGTKILAIHTGGLQGIVGMNERLKSKGLHLNYEENTAAAYPNSGF